MTARVAAGRSTVQALLACAGLTLGAGAHAAEQPVKLSAHFIITMTHVRVGELTWTVDFTDNGYLTSASGKASGVFSVLVKGEGSVTTHGALANGRLVPANARSEVSDEDGAYQVRMTFDNGALKQVENHGAPLPNDVVRVLPEYLRNVTDPLSAMLIRYGEDAFAPANCGRTLRIFDGRRRYDLALTYKRVDRLPKIRGYAGRVLVCNVVLHPIAGYKVGSLLVKYLAGKSDLEMWFAPVNGVAVMAPVRALMPTLVGTMDISADEFAAVAAHTGARAKPVEAAPLAPAKPAEAAPHAPANPVEVAPLPPAK
jgi:hypothetical protein